MKFEIEDNDPYFVLDGVTYNSMEDLVETGLLKFCGCGRPGDAVKYVGRALELINQRRELDYEAYVELEEKIFPVEGASYFMYYWLDNMELTEHGGSVPGWLTEKGKQVLEEIKNLGYEL